MAESAGFVWLKELKTIAVNEMSVIILVIIFRDAKLKIHSPFSCFNALFNALKTYNDNPMTEPA